MHALIHRICKLTAVCLVTCCASVAFATSEPLLPLFDAHLHYSHDAAELIPPDKALRILRAAFIQYALVSSSNDEGTQKLRALAAELILPSLRPYRSRADTATWLHSESIVPYMKERLAKFKYVAIGEFHVSGEDARLPVMKATVELAKQYQLLLHAHSDARAIDILFELDPNATVLWAHSGFDSPETIARMLSKHPRLYADLAFRSDYVNDGNLDPAWRKLFDLFPERFMAGTDTYTPERWAYIGEYANWVRKWLMRLPVPLRERIAYKNAQALLAPFHARLNSASCNPKDGWLEALSADGSSLFVKPVSPPQLSKLFSAQIASCADVSVKIQAIDVVMPEHRHGMNYKPQFEQINAATVKANGLLLHMLGRWQWQLDASLGNGPVKRYVASFDLK
jgi:hypothetical protein